MFLIYVIKVDKREVLRLYFKHIYVLLFFWCFQENYSSVSVNSKPDHPPPGHPPTFARSHFLGGRVFAQLSLPGGRGFELQKFSAVLKEKCRNFSICFKETRGSLKTRCSCAVSYQFLQRRFYL